MNHKMTDKEYEKHLDELKVKLDKEISEMAACLEQSFKETTGIMRDKGFTEDEIQRVICKMDYEPLYERGMMQRPH